MTKARAWSEAEDAVLVAACRRGRTTQGVADELRQAGYQRTYPSVRTRIETLGLVASKAMDDPPPQDPGLAGTVRTVRAIGHWYGRVFPGGRMSA